MIGKKTILILIGAGLLAYNYISKKTSAFGLTSISLKNFKIKSFSGTTLNCLLEVNIQNPTNELLFFNSITGNVYKDNTKLGYFERTEKTDILPNQTTVLPLNFNISVLSIVQSALDLLANGLKTTVLVDTVTDIKGIKIPVRQSFIIDFSSAKNENIVENQRPDGTGVDAGFVDVQGTQTNETPSLVANNVWVNPSPELATANYNGNIDPTGGVVITLPAPSAFQSSAPLVALDNNMYLNASTVNVQTLNLG